MSEVLAQREDVALAQYGDRGQVRELGSRIKHFLPNGNKMSDSDAHSLAQLALAHGLDPFIGDCWWIPGKGIMVGINGLRKAARRASPYSVDIQMMRTNERAEYDVPDGAAAYIARLFRGDIMAQMAAARQPIFPFIGTGVCTKGERIPHTKSAAWVARKRAEADALKAAYDIAFATEPTIESQGVTINGALVGDGAPQIVGQHERSEAEMQQISNSLYGDDDAPGLGDEWDQGIADGEDSPNPVIDAEQVLEPEPAPETEPANGTGDDSRPVALHESLSYLAEVEPNADRDDQDWDAFRADAMPAFGFDHSRHLSNTLTKHLGKAWGKQFSKSQLWAFLAAHKIEISRL